MTEEFNCQDNHDGTIDVSVEMKKDPNTIRTLGLPDEERVITLDDLIERFGINMDEYTVEWFLPNSWETHFKINEMPYRAINYQAKARLKKNIEILTAQHIAEIFRNLAKEHAPTTYKTMVRKHRTDLEGYAAVVDLFDLHVGMLAWAEETGGDDWDSHIAVRVALEAIENMIDNLQGMNIVKIIFPIGNDLLHADKTDGGKGGSTTGGTPQDVDTRYLKMYRLALGLIIAIIDRLRLIAPVEVIVVPGNHDRERMAFLGETVSAWFRNDPEVDVKNSANLRKYSVFGNTLLGFTHGSDEKADSLPGLMAAERKQEWADTEFRVFHTGHLHRKKRMMGVTTDTYNGVEVLTIPSLVPPDAWHSMKGYVGGGRAAEVYLYGEQSGPSGYFRHSVYNKTE